MTIDHAVDRAFNAIIRKTTLPAQELLFVLRQLAAETAQAEFNNVMSAHEAADYWSVDLTAVRARIKRGRVPARKIANTWILRRQEVESYDSH